MLLGVWDGFLNPQEEALSSVSKVGGRPVYMPPNADEIRDAVAPLALCGVCGDPMFLLLQCYCPLPNGNEDFNRMKYIFCCNNATCSQQPEKSWVSVSVTCSTYDAAAERGEGEPGSDEDDVEEMPAAPHHMPFTFPSAGVGVVDEPTKSVVALTDHEQHMMAQYERRMLKQKKIAEMRARGEEPDEQELLEAGLTQEDAEDMEKEIDLKNRSSDVSYDKFRRRIERCPKQVLRYQYKGAPIFMNPAKIKDAKVPACGRCGGPQAMELQIMPTVIFLLRTSEYVKGGAAAANKLTSAAASAEVSKEVQQAVRAAGEGVDFASVTCYTCANPKCGGEEASLFGDAAANCPFALTGKGIVGGGKADEEGNPVKFNIRKDFILVEAAPDLEEDMGTADDANKTKEEKEKRPKTLREIMFAPMPADEEGGEEAGEEEEKAVAAAAEEANSSPAA